MRRLVAPSEQVRRLQAENRRLRREILRLQADLAIVRANPLVVFDPKIGSVTPVPTPKREPLWTPSDITASGGATISPVLIEAGMAAVVFE